MPFEKQETLLIKKTSVNGGIIRYFRKTPPDIVCPHFWELNWAYGCPFNCAWCYLQGTFHGNKKPNFPNQLKWILNAIQEIFDDKENPLLKKSNVFNTGELTDSLMEYSIPNRESFFIEKICDKFEEQNKHKVLLLTKSSNVDFLLKKFRKQVIPSFTLNAIPVAEKWELGTHHVEKRIEAGGKLSDAGYDVRIRIDPIVPIIGWERHYTKLIDKIFSKFKPERITIGSLRGLSKTIRFAKGDRTWINFLTEKNSGWGRKIDFNKRFLLYSTIINYLKNKYDYTAVALCKETPEIWNKLGINVGTYPNWENCKCNCVI
jgi:spore photoproduct lyase